MAGGVNGRKETKVDKWEDSVLPVLNAEKIPRSFCSKNFGTASCFSTAEARDSRHGVSLKCWCTAGTSCSVQSRRVPTLSLDNEHPTSVAGHNCY